MLKRFCDRCKREIQSNRFHIIEATPIGNSDNKVIAALLPKTQIEICDLCLESFNAWIDRKICLIKEKSENESQT